MMVLFRLLIVLSTLMFVAGYVWPYAGASDEMARLLPWDGIGAVVGPTRLVACVYLMAGTVVPALMFFFVPWSRTAFAVLTVASLLGALCWGVRVTTPLASFLGQAVALCDGAILSMAYLTSIARRFNRPTHAPSELGGEAAGD